MIFIMSWVALVLESCKLLVVSAYLSHRRSLGSLWDLNTFALKFWRCLEFFTYCQLYQTKLMITSIWCLFLNCFVQLTVYKSSVVSIWTCPVISLGDIFQTTGNKKSSKNHDMLHVPRKRAAWRHGHTFPGKFSASSLIFCKNLHPDNIMY